MELDMMDFDKNFAETGVGVDWDSKNKSFHRRGAEDAEDFLPTLRPLRLCGWFFKLAT
jgi:hypothetical protein